MKLFIDTANIADIRKANDMGVICGVTTNPSLIAKEGRDFVEVVKEITTIVDGPIRAEVISLNHEGMVAEAEELVAENAMRTRLGDIFEPHNSVVEKFTIKIQVKTQIF